MRPYEGYQLGRVVSKKRFSTVPDTEFILQMSLTERQNNNDIDETNFYLAGCVFTSWSHPHDWDMKLAEHSRNPAVQSVRKYPDSAR